ncbi:MAG TPA: AraC family transcriptional regulator [Ensifer sp.]|jgi:AraC family transcriptional regulator|uniref:helix-turn-helix domain-containing protein n=1 Tax=Ensifer sp. TaxID=1872086 RepID=UPI002E0E45C3|nr:AraC family transcriptional regulator [Ensifer sp.]
MTLSSPLQHVPTILLTSAGRAWSGLSADFIHIPRGRVHVPGGEMHRLGMHFGPPVKADCQCGGRRSRRVQKAGDIDIVPAGVDGAWEDDADCRILRVSLAPSLIARVAGEMGRDLAQGGLRPQMQVRDTRLEAIGWAIKADLEAEIPSDPLYIDLLANALAVRLIETAAGGAQVEGRTAPKLSARQLRTLTEYIETRLDQKLHLAELAAVAGLSATRLKMLFKNSTGLPVHQYVLRRRVEHVRALMTTTRMAASEIAVAAGFAHQSHMAATMRRLLGLTPGDIARSAERN